MRENIGIARGAAKVDQDVILQSDIVFLLKGEES